ncbi:mRNA interferase RelE/StbE [Roseivirga pacifica]|uniref:mRNA interferase RelE/StbE n=1 Tax=Roseivirga pacifica TaxID=1267423 RepID=A0A1I0QRK7_9BACT|nr:type II toxin-antitoxin system RelE/ParE family toxin [Roseivirga pacifica]RKQ42634.1 mRNA interferase RelE/StbE [Roseivirga pacifica]SEW30216.1 mRNA interferase RelE/StbE [Roseivirga pacifica]
MEVVFLKKFYKDLDKIKKSKDLKSIAEIIELVKSVEVIDGIAGVKKLSGFENAFRIRSGNYRIGVFVDGTRVEFARVAHRKDIYKLFP